MKYFSISDAQVRRIAEMKQQADMEDVRVILSNGNLPIGANIFGVAECMSKPIEEYEQEIRGDFSKKFPMK